MKFKIHHQIDYQYSQRVFIEPMVIHLVPRSDSYQNLCELKYMINPQATGFNVGLDMEGGLAHHLWFDQEVENLKMDYQSEVETLKNNPFDFVLPQAEFNTLPFNYPKSMQGPLEYHLKSRSASSALNAFCQDLLQETKSQTLEFLTQLSNVLSSQIEKIHRETGEPLSPEAVLSQRKGACRDITFLWMEACRQVGLAARFVSGYTLGAENELSHELHAWGEVFLPGAGWRGLDPSQGVWVANRHVALSAHPDPEWTLPVLGAFRGTGAHSKIKYQVKVEEI